MAKGSFAWEDSANEELEEIESVIPMYAVYYQIGFTNTGAKVLEKMESSWNLPAGNDDFLVREKFHGVDLRVQEFRRTILACPRRENSPRARQPRCLSQCFPHSPSA